MLRLTKEGSPYFRVLKNKYEEDCYGGVLIVNANDTYENT
jgi:hypothetical protein